MIILGLGSNIGDRLGYLRAAVRRLSMVVSDMRLSCIVESPAMLPPDAPPDMDHPFLNMAVSGHCKLVPQALFAEVKAIERDLGRVDRFVWGPREIDIDILAMDDLILETSELTIPHPGMLKRDFVMLPLADIAPGWKYPLTGPFYQFSAEKIVAAKGYVFSDKLVNTGFAIDD